MTAVDGVPVVVLVRISAAVVRDTRHVSADAVDPALLMFLLLLASLLLACVLDVASVFAVTFAPDVASIPFVAVSILFLASLLILRPCSCWLPKFAIVSALLASKCYWRPCSFRHPSCFWHPCCSWRTYYILPTFVSDVDVYAFAGVTLLCRSCHLINSQSYRLPTGHTCFCYRIFGIAD